VTSSTTPAADTGERTDCSLGRAGPDDQEMLGIDTFLAHARDASTTSTRSAFHL
jgi:hypothetical protein